MALKKSTYPGHDLFVGDTGAAVLKVQKQLRTKFHNPGLDPDGEYGPKTSSYVRHYQEKRHLHADGVVGRNTWANLFGEKIAPAPPLSLQERAYREAVKLIGVMEQGGNNTGPMVSKIIRDNGGVVGEPWCGDFQAFVYRAAGSKAVSRSWASVYYLGRLSGVVKTSKPVRGDLVRYTFSHVGMFVRWRPDLGTGYFETIEGNTGATGAVSDSSTGGDGVYRKVRHISLVDDFRHVTR